MTFGLIKRIIPSWKSILLVILAAVLLILAFPDFEWWFLAWFALMPLMWAVEREKTSTIKSFVLGWTFGTIFFFATCWWLTFAPITYAGFSAPIAYFLLFCVTAAVGLFPAIFAGVLSILLRRFGSMAFIAAPFVWVATEFLRYWVTGNDWNAIGYAQAFARGGQGLAQIGGLLLVSFVIIALNVFVYLILFKRSQPRQLIAQAGIVCLLAIASAGLWAANLIAPTPYSSTRSARAIAIQPNVPMSDLDSQKWERLRQHQIEMAETAILGNNEQRTTNNEPTLVILPESPMNFMYQDDREFQTYINDFARRNHVSVLFNSAEPDKGTTKYFNSAVMVGPEGREIAEYDKIYLLPFGEAVPPVLEGIVPGFVGNFSYGREYDLLPMGDAKAGVMICFESHFGQLSRRYVQDGADVIIEMTNDGYLGPTPVLRQHLANAVFRAVETNRPVLRVTNVGITALITESGEVEEPAASYIEDTRVWSVYKADGQQTFYVRYGDWFAWLCSIVTIGLLGYAIFRRRQPAV